MLHIFTLANDLGTLTFEAAGERKLADSFSDIFERATGRRYWPNHLLVLYPPTPNWGLSLTCDISATIVTNWFEGLDEARSAIISGFESVLQGDNPTVRVDVHINAIPRHNFDISDPRRTASWGPIG